MLLTRRWFLIGSAASIAASKLSLVSNALAKPAEVTRAVIPASSWILHDIYFGGRAEQSFPVHLALSQDGSNDDEIRCSINAYGGSMRWLAMEGHEIKVPPGRALRVKAEPDLGLDADLQLIYENARTGLRYVSTYHWNGGRLTREFLPLQIETTQETAA